MKIIRCRDSGDRVILAQEVNANKFLRIEGDLFSEYAVTDESIQPKEVLAPIEPKAILCIGLNYKAHAVETGAKIPEKPVLFMKMPSALQHPDKPVVLPTHLASHQVDYEVELAVVIGKTCKNVRKEEALDYVLGYTIGNDVSARDWQKMHGGGQWCRGKTFDTFAPLGPCLVTADEIMNPNGLRLQTRLNGNTVQDSNTADMIFDVPTLVAFLSGSTTLLPGTVILTGTPSGVGMARDPQVWLKPGDALELEIESIGVLKNPVVAEK